MWAATIAWSYGFKCHLCAIISDIQWMNQLHRRPDLCDKGDKVMDDCILLPQWVDVYIENIQF